jgi:hypothetical protein
MVLLGETQGANLRRSWCAPCRTIKPLEKRMREAHSRGIDNQALDAVVRQLFSPG